MAEKQPDNRAERTGTLTHKEVLDILEPAQRPFLSVVRKSHFDLVWPRERDFAVQLMTKDDRFRKVQRDDIVIAMKNIAFIGLSLNPVRQHATLIASYDKWAKRYLCRAMIMYRGLTFLATEAGVHGLNTEVVYRDDKFRRGADERRGNWFEYELNPAVDREEKNFIGAFNTAKMPAGDMKFEWVPRKDVFKIRDQSDSYLDENGEPSPRSPWVKWFEEMAKKATLRRASKRWEEMIGHGEKWDRFLKAIKMDNEQEGVINPRPDDIEGNAAPKEEAVPLLAHEQITAITEQVRSPVFRQRICDAYGVDALEKIPADRFAEIIQRIEAAKTEAAAKGSKKKGKTDGNQ